MESSPFEKDHYPGLDVLRGLAILLVLLFHYFAFPIGWIGVDLFFVLSGFLITKSLLRLKGEPGYFQKFFIRRVLRIFPVYYLLLIFFFVASPFLFSQKDAGSVYAYYTGHQAWFWTFTENWLFIDKGLPPEPYLQHLWSLAVEEQFYLCWPLLIYAAKNTKQVRTIVAIIFLLALLSRLILFFSTSDRLPLYYNTLTRADSLAAGALLSTAVRLQQPFSKILAWVVGAFAGLLLCSFLLYKNWNYNNPLFATIGYSLSALCFMLLCQQMIYSTKQFKNLFWLKFLGRISYGLYVYHIPVLLVLSFVVKKYAASFFSGDNASNYWIATISVLATIAISLLSFKLIEQPFLRLKDRFTRPSVKTTFQA